MHQPISRLIVMQVFCGLALAGCAIVERPASPQGAVAKAPYYSQADEDLYLTRYQGLIASGATGGYDPLEPVSGAKGARPLPASMSRDDSES